MIPNHQLGGHVGLEHRQMVFNFHETALHRLSSACGRSLVCFVFDPGSLHSLKPTKLLPQANERLCRVV